MPQSTAEKANGVRACAARMTAHGRAFWICQSWSEAIGVKQLDHKTPESRQEFAKPGLMRWKET